MKQFKDLTLKGQKIRIIKDTIAQIQAKKFKVTNGIYFEPVQTAENYEDYQFKIKGLKELIPTTICNACAIGGIFGACVLNVNEVDSEDSYDREETTDKLSTWFTKEELLLIECAFELYPPCFHESLGDINPDTWMDEFDYNWDSDKYPIGTKGASDEFLELNKQYLFPKTLKAIKFGRKYKNATNRYLAILNNMLANSGTFKP